MSALLERRELLKLLATGVMACSSCRTMAHSLHQQGDNQAIDGSPSSAQSDTGNAVAKHSRIKASYVMPQLPLLDQNGSSMNLARELHTPGPVLMNFIFTSCPGICPILSAVVQQTVQLLGSDLPRVRVWSLSIDPDHDRPEQLHRYARAFNAPKQWQFLTGDAAAIMQVRLAFDADSDNKMAHLPLFLVRQHKDEWLRLEGDVTATLLVAQLRDVLSASLQ